VKSTSGGVDMTPANAWKERMRIVANLVDVNEIVECPVFQDTDVMDQ
jgi:hypothetical protein